MKQLEVNTKWTYELINPFTSLPIQDGEKFLKVYDPGSDETFKDVEIQVERKQVPVDDTTFVIKNLYSLDTEFGRINLLSSAQVEQ